MTAELARPGLRWRGGQGALASFFPWGPDRRRPLTATALGVTVAGSWRAADPQGHAPAAQAHPAAHQHLPACAQQGACQRESGEASAAAVSCQRTRPRPRVKWPLGSVASSRVCAHMAALSGRATWSSSHSVISRHHTEMSSGLCPQVRETASQRGSARPETSPACVIPSRMDCFTCQEAPHGQCAEIASATAVAHRHRSARDCAPHRRTAHPSDMPAASTAQSVRALSSTCALVRFLQWRTRHTAVFEVGPSMRHSRNHRAGRGPCQ